MKIDLDKLSHDERQAIADQLHQAAVYPSRLVGMGTPAHVEAINSNLNDLRQMVATQAANIQRFYEIVAPKVAGPMRQAPQELPPQSDREIDNG